MTAVNQVGNSLTGANATGNFIGGSTSITTDQSTNTTIGTPTLLLSNSADITYPSSANFAVTLGSYVNAVANTTQTINSSTPGGFNFIYGNRILLTYSDAGTNDLSRLNVTGNLAVVTWSSANTAQQIAALQSNVTYNGSNQSGRITSVLVGAQTTLVISPPASSTVTATNSSIATGSFILNHPTNTGITGTYTNIDGTRNTMNLTSAAASNTISCTNMAVFNTGVTLSAAGAGSTLSITNLYGLRLQSPTVGANTTITNRYGISSEDASAINVFAGIISPSQTLGILGTTTNNNAQAGSVGELNSTVVLSGAAVSLTTATPADIVTLVLQPGDYDVSGEVWFTANAATIITSIDGGLNTTSATIPTTPSVSTSRNLMPITLGAGLAPVLNFKECRISVATATTATVYLSVNASFSINTLSAYGVLQARRRR